MNIHRPSVFINAKNRVFGMEDEIPMMIASFSLDRKDCEEMLMEQMKKQAFWQMCDGLITVEFLMFVCKEEYRKIIQLKIRKTGRG